jgi:hypothetical protein
MAYRLKTVKYKVRTKGDPMIKLCACPKKRVDVSDADTCAQTGSKINHVAIFPISLGQDLSDSITE